MDVIQSQRVLSLGPKNLFTQQGSSPTPETGVQNQKAPLPLLDPKQLSIKSPAGLEEILEYFSTHPQDEMLANLDDLNQDLLNQENFDGAMISQLFGFDDDGRQEELRRVLRQLDQANDLERILFGEDVENDPEDYFELFLNFEFKLQTRTNKQTAQSENENIEVSMSGAGQGARQEADPLVFDLDGNGVDTTGIDQGVLFDLDGDGKSEKTSFVTGDDFVLSLDRNHNGKIDSGKELFGDANGFKDGIEELKSFDLNRDGTIDRLDPIFKDLKLFNKNRRPISLGQAGIEKIDLSRLNQRGFTNNGDRYDGALEFELKSGEKRTARDIYFGFRRA